MKRGFYTIMSAQFCSSLADNALFVAAVQLLRSSQAPEWQSAALVPMFALFYVLLAPFVGAFADALPKGRVMFISNAIKIGGCVAMLLGSHPLLAYALVGLGAAAYSPAKYGILTELLPPALLVKANGWIEGLTIASIVLGVLLGGVLLGPQVSGILLGLPVAFLHSAADAAIAALVGVYALAACFNLRIPATDAPLRPLRQHPQQSAWRAAVALLPDFGRCNRLLWQDKLGQIALSTTTLFWGISGNLRYIVLAWGAAALGYGTAQSSILVGVVAVGTALGAVLASMCMRLEHATRVLPLGAAMGVLLLAMIWIDRVALAIPFLIALGALSGFLVVPMNALLQHRGHNLMGAGRSIAVQNLNEQLCILALGAVYSLATGCGLSTFGAIALFALLVVTTMVCIGAWHRHNCRHHAGEVQRLLAIARGEGIA